MIILPCLAWVHRKVVFLYKERHQWVVAKEHVWFFIQVHLWTLTPWEKFSHSFKRTLKKTGCVRKDFNCAVHTDKKVYYFSLKEKFEIELNFDEAKDMPVWPQARKFEMTTNLQSYKIIIQCYITEKGCTCATFGPGSCFNFRIPCHNKAFLFLERYLK